MCHFIWQKNLTNGDQVKDLEMGRLSWLLQRKPKCHQKASFIRGRLKKMFPWEGGNMIVEAETGMMRPQTRCRWSLKPKREKKGFPPEPLKWWQSYLFLTWISALSQILHLQRHLHIPTITLFCPNDHSSLLACHPASVVIHGSTQWYLLVLQEH